MSCDDEPRATVAAHLSDPFATKTLHGRLLRVARLATMEGIAGGVAHELNQPLTAIVNYAHACDRLLARPGADLGEVREALRQIGRQATRAAEVMQRLRQLAGRQHSQQAATSLNTLVAELLDLLQVDAHMHGVELSLELTAQLPEVIVDNGQIQQVILNFFRNSLDALAARVPRRSPRIVIRTSATADHEVELAVSDNGPGSGFFARRDEPPVRPVLLDQARRHRAGPGHQQHDRTRSWRLGGLSVQPASRRLLLHSASRASRTRRHRILSRSHPLAGSRPSAGRQ